MPRSGPRREGNHRAFGQVQHGRRPASCRRLVPQRRVGAVRGGRQIKAGCLALGLSLVELWCLYLAVGGSATPAEMADYLEDRLTLPVVEHDMLAHALNELFSADGMGYPVPYADDLAAS